MKILSSLAWVVCACSLFILSGCEHKTGDFADMSEQLADIFDQGDLDSGVIPDTALEKEPEAVAVCGNGLLEGEESCDDGNTADGDGCSAACVDEDGVATAGNNIIEAGEECDDGNTADGDGCSAASQIEAAPPVTPVCGNGKVEPEAGEECEDLNTVDGDGCSATCKKEVADAAPVCGDGMTEAPETCDDGNAVAGDGCDANCQKECGNGVVDAGEECDCGGKQMIGSTKYCFGGDAICDSETCKKKSLRMQFTKTPSASASDTPGGATGQPEDKGMIGEAIKPRELGESIGIRIKEVVIDGVSQTDPYNLLGTLYKGNNKVVFDIYGKDGYVPKSPYTIRVVGHVANSLRCLKGGDQMSVRFLDDDVTTSCNSDEMGETTLNMTWASTVSPATGALYENGKVELPPEVTDNRSTETRNRNAWDGYWSVTTMQKDGIPISGSFDYVDSRNAREVAYQESLNHLYIPNDGGAGTSDQFTDVLTIQVLDGNNDKEGARGRMAATDIYFTIKRNPIIAADINSPDHLDAFIAFNIYQDWEIDGSVTLGLFDASKKWTDPNADPVIDFRGLDAAGMAAETEVEALAYSYFFTKPIFKNCGSDNHQCPMKTAMASKNETSFDVGKVNFVGLLMDQHDNAGNDNDSFMVDDIWIGTQKDWHIFRYIGHFGARNTTKWFDFDVPMDGKPHSGSQGTIWGLWADEFPNIEWKSRKCDFAGNCP